MIKSVLLIDDDLDIHSIVKNTVRNSFSLDYAETIDQARELLNNGQYDLIVLDEVLPDGSGIELASHLKENKRTSDIPIIMLTRMSDLDYKVKVFEKGADDYVSKPFEPLELLARIKVRLKQTESTNQFSFKDIHFDLTTQKIFVDNEQMKVEVFLTPIEFKILYSLAKNSKTVQTRQDIIDNVWGVGHSIIDRTVDQHISKLRKKMALSTVTVKSLHRRGYQLVVK